MDNEAIAREFMLLARQHLMAAECLMKSKETLWQVTCFHCHKSAEACLKGYLAYNGEKLSRVYDLTALNRRCCLYNKEFQGLLKECVELTDFHFPFQLELNKSDTVEAVRNAAAIQNFVKQLLQIN